MAVPSAGAGLEFTPVLPLEPAPFSLQLALSSLADAADPFVTLSGDDEFARVLLAAIKGDAGTVVEYCAVKLPRNVYRGTLLHEAARWTNAAVEERWADESMRLAELSQGSAGRFAPRWIRPEGSSPESRLPPLFLCRSSRRFFRPPCPRCGGLLETCRDDARLSQAGLPLWSGSLERFLWCSRCGSGEGGADASISASGSEAGESEPRFYTVEVGPELAEKPVGSAADLAQDLGEALAGSGPEGDAVRAALACADCADAGAQFRDAVASGSRPKPFWEDRWVPLAFYDAPFLVTELDPFDLDEFADLLGGRPVETLAKSGPPAAELAAKLLAPDGGAAGGVRRPRWLFEADGSGFDAVEVFALKLAAFRQIAQAVLEYSRALDRPHLDVQPRHVFFEVASSGDGLPVFWNFRARLHGISSAARVDRIADVADVIIPPRNPVVPYAPPEVLEFHLTLPRPAQLVLTELEPERTGGINASPRLRLHGRLSDPYGIFPEPGPQDWILLTLENEALGLPGVSVACRRDPRAAAEAVELTFISEPIEVGEAVASRLRKASGVRIPGIRYKVYADFGTPSDLYSLGMVLLRLLVGNDKQDAGGVAAIVERIAKRLRGLDEDQLARIPQPGGTSALFERDLDILMALKKANVFWAEPERRSERPNAIPDPLWKRAILLGVRLSTRVPGFSLCANPADYDAAHPRAKLEAVLQEIDLIEQQLRSILFERQSMNLEVQQVLSELAQEKTKELGD
jgi:hypothetical protein